MDYFTGKALEYDAEELDDEYEDEDEDEDEFDDDDEDEDDDDVPKKLSGPPKGRGAGAQQVNAEECKQQ